MVIGFGVFWVEGDVVFFFGVGLVYGWVFFVVVCLFVILDVECCVGLCWGFWFDSGWVNLGVCWLFFVVNDFFDFFFGGCGDFCGVFCGGEGKVVFGGYFG